MNSASPSNTHISRSDKQRTCFLVYSTRENHIEQLIQRLSDLLSNELNFSIIKLDEARVAGTQLLPDILKLTKECDLGIVILDGLRPNVLLELGMILANRTPCIILVEKEARVNVESLMRDIGLKSKHSPRIKIDVQKHISDISNTSWNEYAIQDDIAFRKMIRGEILKLVPTMPRKEAHGHEGYSKKLISLLELLDNSKKLSSSKHLKLISEAKKMTHKLPKAEYGHIYFHIARSYLRRNEFQTAFREVVHGLGLDPKYDQLWQLKGLTLLALGQHQEGIKILTTVSKKNPNNKYFKHALLNALNVNNRPRVVLKILSRLTYEDLLIDDLIPIKSHALFLDGKIEESLNLLIELYEYDLNEWAIHHVFYILSNVQIKKLPKKFIQKLEQTLRNAVDRKHFNCNYCIIEGTKAIGLTDYRKEYLEKWLSKIKPKSVDDINQISFELLELGEYKKVDSILKSAIKKFPEHAYLNATRGLYYLLAENNFTTGNKYYLKSRKLSPQDLPLERMHYSQLGSYYLRSGNKKEAKRHFKLALDVKTDDRQELIQKAIKSL